jgi:cyclic pyranopterin phosphate synthase
VTALADAFGRPLRSLRLSVTDRCNLRCQYCMPEADYVWLPQADVLTFEELDRLAAVFLQLGVDKVRITGGEPLLRRDLERLVTMLAARPGVQDLAITTNGVLLAQKAAALKAAGMGRVTVSLDTLDRETFQLLTRRDCLDDVLAGIAAAKQAGFADLKLDSVMIAGVNDGELCDLLDFARTQAAEIRFIEYMDVGGATHWNMERVVSQAMMLAAIVRRFGPVQELPRTDAAPALRFTLPDGTVFGIIASVTQPFCRTCDRGRLTADGMWFTCLYATGGLDLRGLLRNGASDAELAAAIAARWRARTDRGAEVRAGLPDRRPLIAQPALQRDPHLEMHTRGG